MPEYCTLADVRSLLTDAGLEYAADRDQSGGLTPVEQTDFITPAIESAGRELDFALLRWIKPDDARNQANGFLKDRCAALAAERCCAIGGASVPDSVRELAARTRRLLERIRDGERVPNLVYPDDGHDSTLREIGRPMVANP